MKHWSVIFLFFIILFATNCYNKPQHNESVDFDFFSAQYPFRVNIPNCIEFIENGKNYYYKARKDSDTCIIQIQCVGDERRLLSNDSKRRMLRGFFSSDKESDIQEIQPVNNKVLLHLKGNDKQALYVRSNPIASEPSELDFLLILNGTCESMLPTIIETLTSYDY